MNEISTEDIQTIRGCNRSDVRGFLMNKLLRSQCTECIMDDTDPALDLDENGVCWYCRQWKAHKEQLGCIPDSLEEWETKILPKIQKDGDRSRYDCVIGLSGGVDSSFVAYVAKQYNLRPLLVHVAGGFDTKVCEHNIEQVIKHTGFTLENKTVKPEDYRSVQLAYFEAGVIDVDVPADYLIEAFIRLTAKAHDVKYVLSGGNYYADAFMPKAWTYTNKLDWTNLKNINDYFSGYSWHRRLNSFPEYGAFQIIWDKHVYGLKYLTPLNYVGYTREKAKRILQKEWNWRPYPNKHDENIFTRFYQRFMLPLRFGIDKRKMNFSNYVRAGGWTRQQALEELMKPNYTDEMLNDDWRFIKNELAVCDEDLERWMHLPIRTHEEFGTDQWVYKIFENPYVKTRHWIGNLLRKVGLWR